MAAAIHQPGTCGAEGVGQGEVFVGCQFRDEAGEQRQHPKLAQEDESEDDGDQKDCGKRFVS